MRPFNPHRFHGTWRMFRDYGNGEIGDDGIHDLDMAAWGLGVDTLPKQITARGGRMMLHGHASEYPDNMNVTYEYPDGRLLIYENYPFTAYGLHGFDNGNVFYGTEGYMVFSRRGAFSVFLGPKSDAGPDRRQRTPRPDRLCRAHGELPRTPSATARRPRAGRDRPSQLRLGPSGRDRLAAPAAGWTSIPQTERFVDCDEANALLTKAYRSPYGLPRSYGLTIRPPVLRSPPSALLEPGASLRNRACR